jgi:hypothetical protein
MRRVEGVVAMFEVRLTTTIGVKPFFATCGPAVHQIMPPSDEAGKFGDVLLLVWFVDDFYEAVDLRIMLSKIPGVHATVRERMTGVCAGDPLENEQ